MGQIVLANIEMTLDPGSIQRAIDMVNDIKERLGTGLSELARMLTEDLGKNVARMYIGQFPAIDSGALHDSITGEYVDANHTGTISTGVEYAVLVEYGTGIVGAGNPHPGIGDPDWQNVNGVSIGNKTYSSYDQEGHGEAGWWYPSERGWYQPKDGGPRMAWTKGMPSRPFMYYTLRELERHAEMEGGRFIAQYVP